VGGRQNLLAPRPRCLLNLCAVLPALFAAACTTIPPPPQCEPPRVDVDGGCELPGTGGTGGTGGIGGEGGSGGTNAQSFPCTEQGIRNAIAAGGGPHTFGCDGPTRVMTSADILIDNNVTLDGGGDLIVDGNDDHRVFEVAQDATVELRGMTITQGDAADPGLGGGVLIGSGADVTLTGCTILGCAARAGGGGGGIFVSERARLTLIDTTVSGNEAAFGGGISVEANGTADVLRSTISENIATTGFGGGVAVGGALTLTNSTLSGNFPNEIYAAADSSTTLAAATISSADAESGVPTIFTAGALTLTMVNSVLSGLCNEDVAVSGGNNVESPGDTCGLGGIGDNVGVPAGQLNLGPLQQNGGPTQTHQPGAGSVAIDAIDPADCEVEDDQRGIARPQGADCDVGSVEVVP
jgi:hypothetical protein